MDKNNHEDDKRNVALNKFFTAISWFAASSIFVYKHLYLMFIGYTAFFILFPMAYVFMKFSISDCINKSYIIDRGMDEDTVMIFIDESKNIRVSEFISNEILNANFWIVVASLIMAYIGLSWK